MQLLYIVRKYNYKKWGDKMKSKYILLGIIILLFATVGILINKNVNQKNELQWHKNKVDNSFISSLSLAATNFATDYEGNLEDKTFNYNYKDAIANISNASQLVLLSDYNNTNKSLNLTPCTLYKLMEKDENIQEVESNFNLLYENLSNLSRNPNDINATEKLNDFITSFN